MEGQNARRCSGRLGGTVDSPGSAAGGDGRALHVPQHQSVQGAQAHQRRPHGTISFLPHTPLQLSTQRTLLPAHHGGDDCGVHEDNPASGRAQHHPERAQSFWLNVILFLWLRFERMV